jgi:cytochrome c-type protein NapC
MTLEETGQPKKSKAALWVGMVMGLMLTLVVVLASGFMVETTNTDKFCISCHVMTPFRTSWQNSVHGGQNPQGFAAQCVDCHLPHGNFVEYLTAKAITGTHDVIANMSIDPLEHDWAKNAEENRTHFTFDNACRKCHHNLTPVGIPHGGLRAHRTYLLGETDKHCTDCHPHVGHKDMLKTAEEFFQRTK